MPSRHASYSAFGDDVTASALVICIPCRIISVRRPPIWKRGGMKRMKKTPPRCAYCQGRLGLLVSRHWDLRFCSRYHKELYLNQSIAAS